MQRRVYAAELAFLYSLGAGCLIHRTWWLIPLALGVAAAVFALLSADRTRYAHLEDGIAIERVRLGVWRTRRVVRFSDISDVQIQCVRHPRHAAGRPVYAHSMATFRFVDSSGAKLAAIDGRFDEPRQHEYVWLPHDAVDFSAAARLPASEPVCFALQANLRFRNYRSPGAYR